MTLQSPPSRDRLIRTIATLVGNEDIELFVRRALGSNAYGRYTSPAKPRDEQISEILDGVEKDGLERWLFAHLMARWVAKDLVRDIVDACPSIIKGLPDTTQLVQKLVEPIKQKLGRDQAALLEAANVRREISDDLGRLADDIFVHGGLSRLRRSSQTCSRHLIRKRTALRRRHSKAIASSSSLRKYEMRLVSCRTEWLSFPMRESGSTRSKC